MREGNHFLDELGEEALGLDGGDVAPVVTPNENAPFDIQEEQCRHCPRHAFGILLLLLLC